MIRDVARQRQWKRVLRLLRQLDEMLLGANEVVVGSSSVACELETHARHRDNGSPVAMGVKKRLCDSCNRSIASLH